MGWSESRRVGFGGRRGNRMQPRKVGGGTGGVGDWVASGKRVNEPRKNQAPRAQL